MVVQTVPQLSIRFNVPRMLFLNLWNQRWLNPIPSHLISFKPTELFAEALQGTDILFFKSAELLESLEFEFKLFYSIIVDGKKEYLKHLNT